MPQYLSAFALLLMVISPVLIPATITLVHHIIDGVRAVASRRAAFAAAVAPDAV
jgi:small-conductance mechanosensitive channel